VHQTESVRGGKRGGHFATNAKDGPRRNGAFTHLLGERRTIDQFHHDVGKADAAVIGLTEIVDLGDIGMRQRRGRAGLVQDPGAILLVTCVPAGQEFHRDRSPEHLVAGFPDHGHTAAAELGQQFVTSAECLLHLHPRQSARRSRKPRTLVPPK
jgi:hypothetical protein